MSCCGSRPWPMPIPSRGIDSSICRWPERCASSWRTDGICWRRWCDRRWPFIAPRTLFGRLEQPPEGLDLKRGGLFPLVHGIRMLAIEGGILDTSTLGTYRRTGGRRAAQRRLWQQSGGGVSALYPAEAAQPTQRAQPAQGRQQPSADTSDLSHSERDLLRQALHQVKKFQQWLTLHFRLRQ